MASRIFSNLPSVSPTARLHIQQQSHRAAPILTRTYAAVPGQSSNVSGLHTSSPKAQEVNHSRAMDSQPQQDTKSTQAPVSNPSESGLGNQEETTESQAAMKRDPNEPDEKKREKVLGFGQNKKLDAADE